jgi:glycosyltransferase involved in cell wall biosynthesis
MFIARFDLFWRCSLTNYPLVTIGIPTYNRAAGYLRDALESALAQDYPNLDIVVSDNGSTDDTETYVTGLADSRIRYFKQTPSLTPDGNFNFCLEQAMGAYFILLHDDDILDADYISSCLQAANYQTDVGVIRSGSRVIDGERNILSLNPNRAGGLSTGDFFLSWFKGLTTFYFCNTLFNTAQLKALGGLSTKTNLFQDGVAIARLAGHHGRVDVPEVKASFRRHGSNRGSASRVFDWVEDALYLLDVMQQEAPSHQEMIRQVGLPYLCRKCYGYVSAVPNLRERLNIYWQVYDRFEQTYSPLRYGYEQLVTTSKRAVVKVIRPDRSYGRLKPVKS